PAAGARRSRWTAAPAGAPRCPDISRRSRPTSGQTVTVPSSFRRGELPRRLRAPLARNVIPGAHAANWAGARDDMRICSLLPSATDILFAVGLGEDIVAVTHECDVPPGTPAIPVITRTTLDSNTLASGDIDRHVTAAAHGGSSLYELDHATLETCNPDLIITQELCEVCAIGYQQVATSVRRLEDTASTKRIILSVEPQTLPQILDAIVRIGEAARVRDRATRLVGEMRDRLEAIGHVGPRANTRPPPLAT